MATDVVLEPDGRAVAAGHSSDGGGHAFMLARFDAAGALDRGFGAEGVVLTGFPGTAIARATALARQPDGKLVVGGHRLRRRAAARSATAGRRGSRWRATGGDARRGSPPATGAAPGTGGVPRASAVRVAARHA